MFENVHVHAKTFKILLLLFLDMVPLDLYMHKDLRDSTLDHSTY